MTSQTFINVERRKQFTGNPKFIQQIPRVENDYTVLEEESTGFYLELEAIGYRFCGTVYLHIIQVKVNGRGRKDRDSENCLWGQLIMQASSFNEGDGDGDCNYTCAGWNVCNCFIGWASFCFCVFFLVIILTRWVEWDEQRDSNFTRCTLEIS